MVGEKRARTAAAVLPVARVRVDTPLAHLDRPFDYLVEAAQDEDAVVGCRVRVRFAGKLVDGYLVERVDATEHDGRLAFLERVISSEPVLAPEVSRLVSAAAERWAGTFADVVRLAVPPRHAAAEKAVVAPGPPPPGPVRVEASDDYDGGPALVQALTAGEARRVAMTALPGDWPGLLAALAAATTGGGRGAVVVVPDHRDVTRVADALTAAGVEHVALTADLGPAERYRRFLRVRRGGVRCVVGTRAAVWAPVRALGLLVVWDDGDDLLGEPRAPYCHARDVAALRAHQSDAALVLAGFAMTAEAAALVAGGWMTVVEPTADARRRTLPIVRATGEDDDLERDPAARAARLPTVAWRAAREALAAGRPVLVQVPRRGYHLSLHCAGCRTSARCGACAGPLARSAAQAAPACRWCGAAQPSWTCTSCGATTLRAGVVGTARTAEELGRAFAGVTVRTSGGDRILSEVPAKPAVIVATPGAEPVAAGGYGAALLLDGWMSLARPDLRAGEEALRRWLGAAALVQPGGPVAIVAPAELRPVQALIRWRPRWHAERELEDRQALHLPPAARLAALTGPAEAVAELLELAELPPAAEVLGPVPVPGRPDEPMVERMLVRVPRRDGAALASALHAATAVRTARKSTGSVRVEIDPLVLG